jgi:SAM-dependent methyltransferase
VVVAHLYLSARLVEESGRVLRSGGVLALVGFHADQWRETGRRSRFAWDEPDLRDLLKRCDFTVEHLSIETEVQTFGSVEHALAAVVGLQERWRQDGRWFHYIKYLEQGGRQLTRSHLIVKARRR